MPRKGPYMLYYNKGTNKKIPRSTQYLRKSNLKKSSESWTKQVKAFRVLTVHSKYICFEL